MAVPVISCTNPDQSTVVLTKADWSCSLQQRWLSVDHSLACLRKSTQQNVVSSWALCEHDYRFWLIWCSQLRRMLQFVNTWLSEIIVTGNEQKKSKIHDFCTVYLFYSNTVEFLNCLEHSTLLIWVKYNIVLTFKIIFFKTYYKVINNQNCLEYNLMNSLLLCVNVQNKLLCNV